MKKLTAFLLIICILLSFFACGKKVDTAKSSDDIEFVISEINNDTDVEFYYNSKTGEYSGKYGKHTVKLGDRTKTLIEKYIGELSAYGENNNYYTLTVRTAKWEKTVSREVTSDESDTVTNRFIEVCDKIEKIPTPEIIVMY